MKKAEGVAPSLRSGLLKALFAPLSVLFCIGAAVSVSLAQYFANSVYDGWLFDSVSSLALEVQRKPSGAFVDMPMSTQRLFEWDAKDKTFFRISGEHKGLIVGRGDIPAAPHDVDIYQDARLFNGKMDGHDVRIAELELSADEFGEVVTVTVAETTRKRRDLAIVILLSTIVPQLALILVATAAVHNAIKKGLWPLRSIATRLESQSGKELSAIADGDAPIEVRPLTRALNELLQRLQTAVAAQRRFIDDTAHQLRTPLTAIRLQAEEIRLEEDPAEQKLLVEQLLGSTERVIRLSNQLLSLARAEPGSGVDQHFVTLDLVSVARDAGAEWIPRAMEKGIEMQFLEPGSSGRVWVDGNADLIQEALSNLLDNAIKYQQRRGVVRLRVDAAPVPSVSVDDDGPGIPARLRPEMMRRFARGDHEEGTGLGLAIAQEIARLHGGDLELDDGLGGRGLLARIWFRPARLPSNLTNA